MIPFTDFPGQYEEIKNEIDDATARVLKSGWYILGKEVESFEKEFARYLGVKHCIGVGNGLEALQISLMALGVKVGDEVITTPLSAVATALAILAVGAKPVFVDTNNFGQIDENLIPKAITQKTKAILPVHLYGQPAAVDKIRKICDQRGLFLIEDACQAHGSYHQDKKLGTWGHLSCFSFYPTKNLGGFGDGGAVVTDDDRLAKVCRQLRDYGQAEKYIHTRFGLNSRLDEIQAAVLRVKLRHLDENNQKRRAMAKRYQEKLSGLRELDVILPEILEESNFHLFVVKTKKRDKLREFLKEKGISSAIHYPKTIPDQPVFGKKYSDLAIPEAREMAKSILSLPCHHLLSISDVDKIAGAITSFFNQ